MIFRIGRYILLYSTVPKSMSKDHSWPELLYAEILYNLTFDMLNGPRINSWHSSNGFQGAKANFPNTHLQKSFYLSRYEIKETGMTNIAGFLMKISCSAELRIFWAVLLLPLSGHYCAPQIINFFFANNIKIKWISTWMFLNTLILLGLAISASNHHQKLCHREMSP